MLPLPSVQREGLAVGILALSQRAADLRRRAATLTGAEHTAATREALVVETLVTALDSYVSAYVTPADAAHPPAPRPRCGFVDTEAPCCEQEAIGEGCEGPACAEHLCGPRCPNRRLYPPVPPARDTERDAKFPSAAPAVATGEGGSPTRD